MPVHKTVPFGSSNRVLLNCATYSSKTIHDYDVKICIMEAKNVGKLFKILVGKPSKKVENEIIEKTKISLQDFPSFSSKVSGHDFH